MQRILYVEDDLSLIDGLQYTLETSGYTVDNAETIKKALELFKQNLTIYYCWMLHYQMEPVSIFAKRCVAIRLSRLYF